MIDNWVMCIIQWSNYVVRIIYDQKALIWFQSQLPSSNCLEMASKWRWHMKILSFPILSKECHHHRFLALYTIPLFEALRDILRAPQMISLKAQKVPNHLFADQSIPPEIPIDLSGISNNLSLSLSDDPEVQTDLPEGPRWPTCCPRWLLMGQKWTPWGLKWPPSDPK